MIVGPEMKTLRKLHALILINSPELAVVRSLALALADGGIEIVPGDHEIFMRKHFMRLLVSSHAMRKL